MTTYTIAHGRLSPAIFISSPNHNARPQGEVSAIIIHNISLPPARFGQADDKGRHYVSAFFCNELDPNAHPYFQTIASLKVSAHLFILRDGQAIQYVNFNDRAWHAGQSHYLGRNNCNDFSIGIELEGTDTSGYTSEQYHALTQIISAIYHAYPKTKRHLAGHSDIAPKRKTDPGAFDWQRLRQALAFTK